MVGLEVADDGATVGFVVAMGVGGLVLEARVAFLAT